MGQKTRLPLRQVSHVRTVGTQGTGEGARTSYTHCRGDECNRDFSPTV